MSRHYAANWLLTLIVAVLATVAITKPFDHNATQGVVRATAMQAAVAAQSSPNPGCNPALGAGKLGVCAPVQAQATANQLAIAAGDPDHISGHPLGVDISSYQGCQTHFTSISFVFIKFTESTGYTNPCAAQDVRAAKLSHVAYGGYDFLRPGGSSPAAEAAHFVAVTRAIGGDTSLPPVADVEVNRGLSPSQLHAYVEAWAADVRTALHRPVTITYTGNWFWGPQVGGSPVGLLWDSAYASTAFLPASWGGGTFSLNSYHPSTPFWQYSDGRVGPTPHLFGWDSDVFGGTQAQLNALAGARPKPKPHHKRATRADRLECKHLQYDRRHKPHPYIGAAHKRWRALKDVGIACSLRRGAYVRR